MVSRPLLSRCLLHCLPEMDRLYEDWHRDRLKFFSLTNKKEAIHLKAFFVIFRLISRDIGIQNEIL